MLAEAIETTLRVTGALTSLGIRYVVGGSLASSLQGIPRATNDVDLVAAMELEHAAPFVAVLGDEFYADVDMIRDAIVASNRVQRDLSACDLHDRRIHARPLRTWS
jgi:hypothetical protein